MGIACGLGSMGMTFSKFIEILKPPGSPKVVKNAGKMLHPLSHLTGIDFKIFITRFTHVPQVIGKAQDSSSNDEV